MRVILISIFGILLNFLLLAGNYQYNDRFFIHKASNVKINWFPTRTMFHKSWWRGTIKGKVKALKKSELKRHVKIIYRSMAKYPTSVLRNYLKNVFLLSKLAFYGADYGGTYYKKNLFFANKGSRRGFSNLYLEQSFHHEFSSVLFIYNKYRFPIQQWKQANKSGFRYGKGGTSALLTGKSGYARKKRYLQIGLLNQYAGASIEEDINVFAETLFTDKYIFVLGKKYPRIGKKVKLLIRFYRSIHSRFTKAYFLKMTR